MRILCNLAPCLIAHTIVHLGFVVQTCLDFCAAWISLFYSSRVFSSRTLSILINHTFDSTIPIFCFCKLVLCNFIFNFAFSAPVFSGPGKSVLFVQNSGISSPVFSSSAIWSDLYSSPAVFLPQLISSFHSLFKHFHRFIPVPHFHLPPFMTCIQRTAASVQTFYCRKIE